MSPKQAGQDCRAMKIWRQGYQSGPEEEYEKEIIGMGSFCVSHQTLCEVSRHLTIQSRGLSLRFMDPQIGFRPNVRVVPSTGCCALSLLCLLAYHFPEPQLRLAVSVISEYVASVPEEEKNT